MFEAKTLPAFHKPRIAIYLRAISIEVGVYEAPLESQLCGHPHPRNNIPLCLKPARTRVKPFAVGGKLENAGRRCLCSGVELISGLLFSNAVTLLQIRSLNPHLSESRSLRCQHIFYDDMQA